MFWKSTPKVVTDEQEIDEILDRGVIVEFLPTKELFKKELLSGRRLRFYIGFDATAPTLHLSHAKNLVLLEKFRKLGHEVVCLFGDFTARIGDPTDRSDSRKQLSHEEILANVSEWKKQIKNLMNFSDPVNPPLIKYNSHWLSKLTFEDVIGLAAETTVQQMLERDMFEKRMGEGKPIHLHEFLYPLMQGYDSVAMDVDVELCGTDQTFNALMGRTLVRKRLKKEKFVVVVNLMANPKTGELMSKSKGTGVFLNTGPVGVFGAVMAQPDEMSEVILKNISSIPLSELDTLLQQGKSMDLKILAAYESTAVVYGKEAAEEARQNFKKTFSKGEVPTDVPEVEVGGMGLMDALVAAKVVSSKSDYRRLMSEGAVRIVRTDEKLTEHSLPPYDEVVRIGKHRFVKIVK